MTRIIPYVLLLILAPLAGSTRGDDPAVAAAEKRLGQACLQKLDWDAAKIYFDRALAAVPNDIDALVERAGCYPNDQNDRAIADLTRAIAIDPKRAKAWADRAGLRVDQDPNDPSAMADLDEAVRLDPKNGGYRSARGGIHAVRDQFDAALADFDAAAALGETTPTLFLTRALIRLTRLDSPGAIADLDRAIQVDRACLMPELYLIRAMAHLTAGHAAACHADADQFAESNPHDKMGLLLQIMAVRTEKQMAAADRLLDALLAEYPDESGPLSIRASRRWEAGDQAGAWADINRALRQRPDEPWFLTTRAYFAIGRHDYPGALADYARVIDLKPDQREASDLVAAFSGQAWIWATCPDARFRDGPRALAAATQARDLAAGQDQSALAALAAAEAEAGRFAAATRLAQVAIALPEPPPRAPRYTLTHGKFEFNCRQRIDTGQRHPWLAEAVLAAYRAEQPYRDDR